MWIPQITDQELLRHKVIYCLCGKNSKVWLLVEFSKPSSFRTEGRIYVLVVLEFLWCCEWDHWCFQLYFQSVFPLHDVMVGSLVRKENWRQPGTHACSVRESTVGSTIHYKNLWQLKMMVFGWNTNHRDCNLVPKLRERALAGRWNYYDCKY